MKKKGQIERKRPDVKKTRKEKEKCNEAIERIC